MSDVFAEKIADLHADISAMKGMQSAVKKLLDRNTEASKGSCLLDGIEVLLREAIMHYEADIETYAGHEPERPA